MTNGAGNGALPSQRATGASSETARPDQRQGRALVVAASQTTALVRQLHRLWNDDPAGDNTTRVAIERLTARRPRRDVAASLNDNDHFRPTTTST